MPLANFAFTMFPSISKQKEMIVDTLITSQNVRYDDDTCLEHKFVYRLLPPLLGNNRKNLYRRKVFLVCTVKVQSQPPIWNCFE